jgi:hypothetical protein
VHIPRTGGSSIETVFLDLRGLTWQRRRALLLSRNDRPDRGPRRLAHLCASEYVSCGYLPQREFDAYYKFAFVRNPWSRLVSEYKFRLKYHRYSFQEFIFSHFPNPGWTDFYSHIRPQTDFLFDEKGVQLVDFIGRFEKLQQDFDIVCSRLGIPERPLPHIRQEAHLKLRWGHVKERNNLWRRYWHKDKPYERFYKTKDMVELVGRIYRSDIDAFGYKFGDAP